MDNLVFEKITGDLAVSNNHSPTSITLVRVSNQYVEIFHFGDIGI